MKTRVISAAVALLIFVPLLLTGGMIFNIAACILAILALKEFIDIKETKKKIPEFMKFVAYVLITLIVLFNLESKETVFSIDYRVVSALLLGCLLPVIVYHDRKFYSVNDAFYLIGGIFFIGSSFSLFILLRNVGLSTVIYLLLISIMTDTYAYITGMLIGRHKLLPEVSPKKTWEGSIGGSLMGTFTGVCFYVTVINPEVSMIGIILTTFFLSVVGQFGDLVFSSIKRYFGKKDFSNIMPGHGGVLDRLDSIIFIVLGFMFFMNML
ncbi:MAG: CDP-archaeol synthase [Firmicutes bacterium]|nr:CDP-archaeol synthase [Bacillota bacterium]